MGYAFGQPLRNLQKRRQITSMKKIVGEDEREKEAVEKVTRIDGEKQNRRRLRS